MSDELPPIDESLRALVDAERGAAKAPAPGKTRVKARLDALTAPVPGGGGGGGAGAAGSALGRLAAVFAAGAIAGGAVVYALVPPQIVERVVQVERPAAPLPSGTALASSPLVQRSALPPSSAAPPEAEDAAAPVAIISARPPGDSLAAERALLDPARTALGRGDGASALAAAAKHEVAFRGGALAEEREAIAVQALVQVKRKEEARARGERFLVRYPGSVLAPAVKAALEAAQ